MSWRSFGTGVLMLAGLPAVAIWLGACFALFQFAASGTYYMLVSSMIHG